MSAHEHPLVKAARELERRDAELASQIDELTRLEAEIAQLRAGVGGVDERRLELPVEREQLVGQVREAQLEVSRRHAAVSAAQAAVERAEDRDAAERAFATAETALADAEARVARLRGEKAAVEHEAEGIEAESARLAGQAQELGARIGVEVGDDVEQWAARARAAAFAERTHAEGERLRIQEEASELASAVTGEPLVGDLSQARRAVEAAVGQ